MSKKWSNIALKAAIFGMALAVRGACAGRNAIFGAD